MKKLTFYILVFIFYGCQQQPQVLQQIPQASKPCPEKPTSALNTKNVKEVTLSNQIVRESGQVSANKSIAYIFEGRAGQEFKRKTLDDICIWLYTPDNQIIHTEVLPNTGKYIVQITAPQGATSFNLEMSLLDYQSTNISKNPLVEPPKNSFIKPRNKKQSLNSQVQPIGWIWLGAVENKSGIFSYGSPLIPTQRQPVTITPSVVPSPGNIVTLKTPVNLRDSVPQPPAFKLTNKLSQPIRTGQQVQILRIEGFIDKNSDSTKIWAQIEIPR